jgi:hypothetical protein
MTNPSAKSATETTEQVTETNEINLPYLMAMPRIDVTVRTKKDHTHLYTLKAVARLGHTLVVVDASGRTSYQRKQRTASLVLSNWDAESLAAALLYAVAKNRAEAEAARIDKDKVRGSE